MSRTKASRIRILVPSALTAVILLGAAAPASALDGEKGAALTERVATVQQQIDERVAAAGPIDDLLGGLTKTLQDLLKSLTDLIKLPAIPGIPEIKLPDIKLPEIPGVKLPEIKLPEIPKAPAIPAVPPAADDKLVPDLPDLPDIPIR
ncbi:hypothetical protein OHS33_15200 [Streptomyces sp. NBC_00536]|uniref:hypothetical protein n=1 Tax=Streptomyces sp. NBC_00536 TaxID=2975769 RepID=UPI002E816732|nr:hypothetical protein [Streptomyces sp. NBC_00536]WUC79552.1 hypothetical protein OHS33_15200 [Streptomyces sp. NBC_00536]